MSIEFNKIGFLENESDKEGPLIQNKEDLEKFLLDCDFSEVGPEQKSNAVSYLTKETGISVYVILETFFEVINKKNKKIESQQEIIEHREKYILKLLKDAKELRLKYEDTKEVEDLKEGEYDEKAVYSLWNKVRAIKINASLNLFISKYPQESLNINKKIEEISKLSPENRILDLISLEKETKIISNTYEKINKINTRIKNFLENNPEYEDFGKKELEEIGLLGRDDMFNSLKLLFNELQNRKKISEDIKKIFNEVDIFLKNNTEFNFFGKEELKKIKTYSLEKKLSELKNLLINLEDLKKNKEKENEEEGNSDNFGKNIGNFFKKIF